MGLCAPGQCKIATLGDTVWCVRCGTVLAGVASLRPPDHRECSPGCAGCVPACGCQRTEPVLCDECGVKHRPGENTLCPRTIREAHPAWKEAAKMNEWVKPHVAPAPPQPEPAGVRELDAPGYIGTAGGQYADADTPSPAEWAASQSPQPEPAICRHCAAGGCAPAPPAEAKHHEEDCVCRECRPSRASPRRPRGGEVSGLVDRCQRLAMAAACLARARAYLGDALYWFAINGDAAEAAALCRNALDGARFGAGYVQWVKADREREESADDAARGEAGKNEGE